MSLRWSTWCTIEVNLDHFRWKKINPGLKLYYSFIHYKHLLLATFCNRHTWLEVPFYLFVCCNMEAHIKHILTSPRMEDSSINWKKKKNLWISLQSSLLQLNYKSFKIFFFQWLYFFISGICVAKMNKEDWQVSIVPCTQQPLSV